MLVFPEPKSAYKRPALGIRSFALRSFGLLLIRSLLFCSISLILKSNHEQFAHIALYKRVTMNNSLMSLFKKEPCEVLLVIRANHLQKTSNLLKKSYFCMFFPFLCPKANRSSRSRRSLQKSDHERFAQVAHDKRATVSDSLRSLMTKEQWEIFAFLLFRSKNEQIAQKTDK